MPKRSIPAVIVFISIIIGTAYAFYSESSFINGFNTVEGTVTKLGDKSTSTVNGKTKTRYTQAIVSFTVNAKTYKSKGRGMFPYPRWEIDQEIDILYSADNPNLSRIDRIDEIYFLTIIGLSFILMCIFFGSVNYIVYKVRGKPLS